MRICALINTYNQKYKLESCLKALLNQSYKDFDIIICDNSSTDGTFDYIEKFINNNTVKYINTKNFDKNGFAFGINNAYKEGYDWIWLLHDDTLPSSTALEELLKPTRTLEPVSFLTSSIFTVDNKAINTPEVSNYSQNGYKNWYPHLDKGLVRIASASCVSSLINRKAIDACGLPDDESRFDDNSNYLSKLVGEYAAGYIVGKSKVIHDTDILTNNTIYLYKICAVIVTYNRKKCLAECIEALEKQTYKNFDILVIDNASTDGTSDYIGGLSNENLKYYNTGKNLGGSGGFYYGMKTAFEENYDWFWIMDDDVVPSHTALKELLEALKYVANPSFLASAVYSPDGKAMNTPEISRYSTNGYKFWYEHLDNGLIRLAHATFVSLLINRKAVEICGLPCKDYFIWGDDTEYTMRVIGKFGAAYMVGKSKVIHNRAISSTLSLQNETNAQRIKMYYFMIRNTLLNSLTYFGKDNYKAWLKTYYKDCKKIALHGAPDRKLKIHIVLKAISDFKKGKYNKKAFSNRYRLYGQEKAVISCSGDVALNQAVKKIKGSTINHVGNDFSLFIDFEDSPIYLETITDNSKITTIENFNDNYKKLIDPDEYFVFDFTGSFREIAIFSSPHLKFKTDSKSELAKLCGYKKNELPDSFEFNIIDACSLYEKEHEISLMKFVFSVTQIFKTNKLILIKHHLHGFDDKLICEKNKLLDELYDEFIKRVPQCHIIEEINLEHEKLVEYYSKNIDVIITSENRIEENKRQKAIRKAFAVDK